MKFFLKIVGLILLVISTSVLSLLYPRLRTEHVQGPFEVAAMLEDAMRQGEDSVRFLSEDIDLDQVYTALEARYPYAFSLHATTGINGVTELRVELSRPARQQQAWHYAQALARKSILDGMSDTEKLRALHDTLVRLCQYDTGAAADTAPDGATAPFAADGALIQHKAVCAGYGRAYGMLCEAAGLNNVIYISSEKMNHGWNAVRVDGITYFIDCTFDDPVPDQGDYVSSQYFMLTAKELAQTHQWDSTFYERMLDFMEQQEAEEKEAS